MIAVVKEFVKSGKVDTGLAELGRSKNFNTITGFSIPVVNGLKVKPKLSDAEKKEFTDKFGIEVDSNEYNDFLKDYKLEVDAESVVWNTDNLKDWFNYQYATKVFKYAFAANVKESENPMISHQFQIIVDNEDIKVSVSKQILRNKAISKLTDLYENNPNKLVNIAKYILPKNSVFGITVDHAYSELDSFIQGKSNQISDPDTIFLNTLETDYELIELTNMVREAMSKSIIRKSMQTGLYVNAASMTELGRDVTEIVDFLRNPNNEDIRGFGLDSDKPHSIYAQLKFHNKDNK